MNHTLSDKELIKRFKLTSKLKILDVGGSLKQHDEVPIHTLADFTKPEEAPYFPSKLKAKHFVKVDFTKDKLPFKDKEFDFCLCTHTLEDLSNPSLVIKEMSRVAKRGYIATPSMGSDMEFTHYNVTDWLTGARRLPGQPHHKWFFINDNNIMRIIPKDYPLLYTSEFHIVKWSGDKEFQFPWENTIQYEEVKDINLHALIAEYRQFMAKNQQYIKKGSVVLYLDNPLYMAKEWAKLLLKRGRGFTEPTA